MSLAYYKSHQHTVDACGVRGELVITSAEEVQNLVENKQVIIVELYNGNKVITQNVINTSEDRRDKYK